MHASSSKRLEQARHFERDPSCPILAAREYEWALEDCGLTEQECYDLAFIFLECDPGCSAAEGLATPTWFGMTRRAEEILDFFVTTRGRLSEARFWRLWGPYLLNLPPDSLDFGLTLAQEAIDIIRSGASIMPASVLGDDSGEPEFFEARDGPMFPEELLRLFHWCRGAETTRKRYVLIDVNVWLKNHGELVRPPTETSPEVWSIANKGWFEVEPPRLEDGLTPSERSRDLAGSRLLAHRLDQTDGFYVLVVPVGKGNGGLTTWAVVLEGKLDFSELKHPWTPSPRENPRYSVGYVVADMANRSQTRYSDYSCWRKWDFQSGLTLAEVRAWIERQPHDLSGLDVPWKYWFPI